MTNELLESLMRNGVEETKQQYDTPNRHIFYGCRSAASDENGKKGEKMAFIAGFEAGRRFMEKRALYSSDFNYLNSHGFSNEGFDEFRQQTLDMAMDGYHIKLENVYAKQLRNGDVLCIYNGYDDHYYCGGWALFDEDGYNIDGAEDESPAQGYSPYRDVGEWAMREIVGSKRAGKTAGRKVSRS